MNTTIYDPLLPNEKIVMPRQASALNGDSYACAEFLKLKEKFDIKKIIEAGSCVFGSTKWFAEVFEQVVTIEISEEFRNIGLERVKGINNIESLLGDTVNLLPSILEKCDDKTMVFLDSHWYEHFPLIEELKIIAASKLKPVIIVHDAFVPNESKLGYDSYNGVDISYATMKPYLDSIYGENGYEYHYNSDETSTEVKRGIIYCYPKI